MSVRNHRLSVREIVKNGAEIFHDLRWSHGIVVCPYCGSVHIKEYDGYRYKCNSCKNRFSDKTNTLMHGSKLSVSTWILDNTDAKEIQSHHRIYSKCDL